MLWRKKKGIQCACSLNFFFAIFMYLLHRFQKCLYSRSYQAWNFSKSNSVYASSKSKSEDFSRDTNTPLFHLAFTQSSSLFIPTFNYPFHSSSEEQGILFHFLLCTGDFAASTVDLAQFYQELKVSHQERKLC